MDICLKCKESFSKRALRNTCTKKLERVIKILERGHLQTGPLQILYCEVRL